LIDSSERDLTSWHGDWSGLRVVVVGLGATGFALVDTLVELGAHVAVVASDATDDRINLARVIGSEVMVSPSGEQRIATLVGLTPDFAVVSPGVSADDPVITHLSESGIPVFSDVDLAWRLRDKNTKVASWIIVSGEKEGVRAAQLAARILNAAGRPTLVVGSGFDPLLDALRDPHPYEMLIVVANEPSLQWWERFSESSRRPVVAVCVEEDSHTNSGVLYDGVKLACVYRRGVGTTEARVEQAEVVDGARAISVGLDAPGKSDVGLVQEIMVDRAFLDDRANQAWEISTLEELAEAGWALPDDIVVILTATAIARACDVSPEVIAGVLSLP